MPARVDSGAMPIPCVIQSLIEAQGGPAPRTYDDLWAVLEARTCVLAAADVFHALGDPRPHRSARETAAAAQSRGSTERNASWAPPASRTRLGCARLCLGGGRTWRLRLQQAAGVSHVVFRFPQELAA
jgi:hypothetical protein